MTNVDLVRLAERRGRLAPEPSVDPVTAEVIRNSMETVCFEMAQYVSRTATTPILNQSNERNATVLDAQGRLAALSVGIPQFMLTSTLPVRFALDFLGPEEFREGDVFVANDPYHGGGHLPDYNVFAPVYGTQADGTRRMVLICSIQCHHGDTGGSVPGGYNVTAADIWGEGSRWPVVKVIDRGEERRDVLYALTVNNRLPDYIGDLRAQMGAAQMAAERLGAMIDRYTVATVEESVDYMIDYASLRFREEVASWPDGTYEGDAYVDHDPLGNPDIHLHVKITVDGDRLVIDYTGSDTRDEIQAWSTYGNTRGYTVAQIASMMDPEIPKNEGFFDSLELVVPAGCVLNPAPGKPVSAGTHHPGADIGEVIAVDHAARAARAGRAPDLQDRHPHDHPGRRPPHGGHLHRPLGRGLRRLVQRREGHGRLGLPGRLLRQPLEGHGRDQREPLPPRAVEPGLPDRLGRAGPVARPVRQPLPQGGPGPQPRLHLRRRHEVPDARHRRRRARCAQRHGPAGRLRRPVPSSPTPPTGCPWRPATSSSTTTAAAAVGVTPSTGSRKPCSTTCSTSTSAWPGPSGTTASCSPAPSMT